jgi:streptogramin lyase
VHRRTLLPVLALLALVGVPPASASAARTISEYLAPGEGVNAVAQGPNGDTWFTMTENPGRIGRITPLGGITTFTTANGLTKDAKPGAITAGPGGMWFTETAKNRIGRITETGTVTEYALGPVGKPTGITLGPDGNLWYTAVDHDSGIGRLSPTGTATEFTTGLTKDGRPQDITPGPDGALWFTEPAVNKIGRITPQGTITEYATRALNGMPREIVAGPDGNLWFTLPAMTPAIGRITPQGAVTLFSAGLPLGSAPEGIAVGNDGALHFTDAGANAIGRITTSGAITIASVGITASQLGGIATGSDGALWFGEYRGALGRATVQPAAETVTASGVTSSAATLTGRLKPNSQATTASIEWGTTASYGQATASTAMGISGSSQALTAQLTGLAPQTTYHARVVATNATGTSYGPDRTFRTTALNAPSATTEPASDVDHDSARLNASINPAGNATTHHFEWGTTDAYGAQVPLVAQTIDSDTATQAVSQPLTELEPNTTYHFRVVASSSAGETAGDDQTFTTDAIAPGLSDVAATGVGTDGATLMGAINPRNSATTYRFDWGPTTSYGSSMPANETLIGSDNTPHAVAQALAGLQPNTTYHLRLVATSPGGTEVGADQTFTTAMALPLVDTQAPVGVTSRSATLKGTADPSNARAVTWFEYGTATEYGSATPPRALPNVQPHPVSHNLSGLEPATTYHVRLVASSGAGIAYGPDRTFTTSPAAAPAAPGTPTEPAATPRAEPPAAVPAPALGKTVVAGVVSGTVRVRTPDGKTFTTLSGADDIPSGSVIDAREGTMRLVSALDSKGRTQEATFRGARFRVVQPKTGRGMVDIHLDERRAGCSANAGAFAAAAKRKPRTKRASRTLWAQDHNGRYRTHGRNSVATVRGTRWSTTETCAGTRTTVTEGAVLVRDKHARRSVLVKAGRSHLARTRR